MSHHLMDKGVGSGIAGFKRSDRLWVSEFNENTSDWMSSLHIMKQPSCFRFSCNRDHMLDGIIFGQDRSIWCYCSGWQNITTQKEMSWETASGSWKHEICCIQVHIQDHITCMIPNGGSWMCRDII